MCIVHILFLLNAEEVFGNQITFKAKKPNEEFQYHEMSIVYIYSQASSGRKIISCTISGHIFCIGFGNHSTTICDEDT